MPGRTGPAGEVPAAKGAAFAGRRTGGHHGDVPPPPTILAHRQARRRRQRVVRVTFVLLVGALLAVATIIRSDPTRTLAEVDPDNLGVGPPLPELAATGWLNSGPLTGADLAGRVVLYNFWTFSCASCIRVQTHVRQWHDRYRGDGLVVVGVHSPRFEFEKPPRRVETAVGDLAVTWPVALDADGNIATAFRNRGWPTRFVADRQGALRYVHPGEGRYDETEAVIRELLGVPDEEAPAARPAGGPAVARAGEGITAEVVLRAGRAGVVGGGHDYGDGPEPPALGRPALAGRWEGRATRLRALGSGAALEVAYRAREVNMIMGAVDGPVEVVVELDGFPLPRALRTPSIEVDPAGHTFVRVDGPGLYRLVLAATSSRHVLRLEARQPGLDAYAVSFG